MVNKYDYDYYQSVIGMSRFNDSESLRKCLEGIQAWCGISLRVFIKLNTRREIPYLLSLCLFYKLTKTDVFDDFPKISDHFPKILKKLSEG